MPRQKKSATEKSEIIKTPESKEYYQAIGRRKESTARVRLYVNGNGEIVVNNRPIDKYFPGEFAKLAYLEPLKLTDSLDRFRITVKVEGGGLSGQLGAVVHGIARTLDKINRDQYHLALKKANLLTRDPRAKERRKAGFAHKARARKQSPKR
ncbi:MAG: 30S ribosomal protein S9 [Candidatus Gottesmanbacteria bacterium]